LKAHPVYTSRKQFSRPQFHKIRAVGFGDKAPQDTLGNGNPRGTGAKPISQNPFWGQGVLTTGLFGKTGKIGQSLGKGPPGKSNPFYILKPPGCKKCLRG